MSSEAGAVTERASDSQGLVPKLRFSEFSEHPLDDVRLGDVTQECKARNKGKFAADLVMGVSKEEGIVPMQARLVADDISRYKILRKDWFAYNPMRLNIGSIGRWQGDSEVLVSPDYVVFRCEERDEGPTLRADYLDHFRRSTHWSAFAGEAGDGGVRVRIYYDDIAKVRLILPDNAEQQKIAACLSSLDALISAETDKLAALRDHKKGLMQQIFPRPERVENGIKIPAETTPRFRFPEFRNAGEWETKPLGEIFDTASGGTPDRKKKEFWDGEIPWITTSLVDGSIVSDAAEFITVEGLKGSSAKLFPKNTVLIAMYGQGKTRGKVALLGIEAATNQACAAILPKAGIDPAYVFLNLCARYEEIRALSNSGGQDNLSQELVGSLPFPFPHDEKEQNKIAECLSSFDSCIIAQNGKIEALNAHKSGLIQQLIPSPTETTE